MAGCAPFMTSIAWILPVTASPKLDLEFKYFIPLLKCVCWSVGVGGKRGVGCSNNESECYLVSSEAFQGVL